MSVRPSADVPWQTYRDVRLRALRTNPEAFGSSLEREMAFDDARWVERASHPWTLLWLPDGDEPAASSGAAPRADGLAGLWPAAHVVDDAAAESLPDALGVRREKLAFVTQVWVEPARRGSGVFDELAHALVHRAREAGIEAMALHVFRSNERAAAAYRRHGFTLVRPASSACPEDEDEYVLHLG